MTTVYSGDSSHVWMLTRSNNMRAQALLGYARLMRPANLPTAASDILTGAVLAGALPGEQDYYGDTFLLLLASVSLYAGGVVMNDVFDLPVDQEERPERPIPSGLVPRRSAGIFGMLLLGTGCLLAFLTNAVAGVLSLVLALFILLYDSLAKKHGFFGPLTMGFCRMLNLSLGMAVIGLGFIHLWYFTLIPLTYIFAITLISRGEVHGNNKNHLLMAMFLYAVVIAYIVYLLPDLQGDLPIVVAFLAGFGYMIYRPLIAAFMDNSPLNIKRAVISGVLGLVLMDAALAAGFGPWWYAFGILLLLPFSLLLSKIFAVT